MPGVCPGGMFKLRFDRYIRPGFYAKSQLNNVVDLSFSSENLMQSRLGEHGLQSIDVGGAGDCFFRSVSHQLYGSSNHHVGICTGVQFMRDNPEKFIESNTENSWLRYLNNMSIQGTWADATYHSSSYRCIKSYYTNS